MIDPSYFDVIIIGAGSVGTPTAFSMAESGLKTLVLDALPCPGQGSNKKAIGGLRATHSDPAKIRLCPPELGNLLRLERAFRRRDRMAQGRLQLCRLQARRRKNAQRSPCHPEILRLEHCLA